MHAQEKHKAAELEVEELKKQVSALEADKERLQRALEEATRSVKVGTLFISPESSLDLPDSVSSASTNLGSLSNMMACTF